MRTPVTDRALALIEQLGRMPGFEELGDALERERIRSWLTASMLRCTTALVAIDRIEQRLLAAGGHAGATARPAGAAERRNWAQLSRMRVGLRAELDQLQAACRNVARE